MWGKLSNDGQPGESWTKVAFKVPLAEKIIDIAAGDQYEIVATEDGKLFYAGEALHKQLQPHLSAPYEDKVFQFLPILVSNTEGQIVVGVNLQAKRVWIAKLSESVFVMIEVFDKDSSETYLMTLG